jgi:pimeloyl-ACP methyl ester carboxylesterase
MFGGQRVSGGPDRATATRRARPDLAAVLLLVIAASLVLSACSQHEAAQVTRQVAGAVFGEVQVANTGGQGASIFRTPSPTDRIRSWPDGTMLTVIGPDVDAGGQRWKHVVDPFGVAGDVPAQAVVAISTGTDLAEIQRIAGDAVESARGLAGQGGAQGPGPDSGSILSRILGVIFRDTTPATGSGPAAKPRPEPPLRVAILLPGINTDHPAGARPENDPTFGQIYRLLDDSKAYDDIVLYSYNRGTARRTGTHPEWNPLAYAYTDTFRKLDESAKQLRCQTQAYQAASDRPVRFDLIGHSLGGAVAFRYVRDGGEGVVNVVTLDSPINGANPHTGEIWTRIQRYFGWLHHLPFPGHEDIRRASEMFDSPVAQELKEQAQDPVASRLKTTQQIQELRKKGVIVRAYANKRDLVVSPLDASVGWDVEITRGRNLEDVWIDRLGINAVNALPWLLDSRENHGLITRVLDDDPEARIERSKLCEDLAIQCHPI